MDVAADLLEAWNINARLNLKLLDALTPEQFAVPLAKGKAVSGQFGHIVSVRKMWAKAIDPATEAEFPEFDSKTLTLEAARDLLTSSAAVLARLIEAGLVSGRIKNFKPSPAAFVCYLVSHESFHRSQIEITLRQAGLPLPQTLEYGLWQWGTT